MKGCTQYALDLPLTQDSSGKWRFIGIPKNEIILVVTIASWFVGVDPKYAPDLSDANNYSSFPAIQISIRWAPTIVINGVILQPLKWPYI